MSDYVQLKNLQGQPLKPVTDLAAINMTTTNGIQVVPANGGTIGITSGYINSAYYVDMVSEDVGPASTSSAYIEGGTATLITGAYTVTSAVNSSTPSQQKIPSEAAVVSALNNVVTSGTSYYAGTGIAIDAGHTVSVSGVPTSAVAGLDTQLTNINAAVAAKQDAISAGYRMSLDGTTLNQQRYFPVKDTGTSATITLEAGSAYKIQATTGSKTLTAETVSAGMFGLEGHAEIFIAGAGLIKTTSNVILAQPLEPDSVNNCTVRFHDGRAIISIEDHIAGHVVRSSGSGTESLKYWLETANTSDQATQYISVDASLDHTGLDFASATVNGEKHLVGNGYEVTSVGGMINCGTSKFTVSNLSLINTAVTGGTMTLGDVYIPQGATVSVSGGGLAVEKVTGNGGVIDLGGTHYQLPTEAVLNASGCTFTGGSSTANGGVFYLTGNTKAYISGCTFSSNSTGNRGGAIAMYNTSDAILTSCAFVGNQATSDGQAVYINAVSSANIQFSNCIFSGHNGNTFNPTVSGGTVHLHQCVFEGNSGGYGTIYIPADAATTVELNGCTIGVGEKIYPRKGTTVSLVGSNVISGLFTNTTFPDFGTVEIQSGAVVDLTGNTNTVPINATASSGSITFAPGGATVLYSSGAVSGSYTMDNVTLLVGAKLTNTAVVDLGGKSQIVVLGSANISGCNLVSGYNSGGAGGAAYVASGGVLNLASVDITGCTAVRGAVGVNDYGTATLTSCTITGNTNNDFGGGFIATGSSASLIMSSCYISGNIVSYAKGGLLNIGATGTIIDCEIYGDVMVNGGASAVISGTNTIEKIDTINSGFVVISSGATITLTDSIAPGGTGGIQVVGGTCTVNGNVIESGTYTSIDSNGQPT